jgi:type IV secretion system protein VirD4
MEWIMVWIFIYLVVLFVAFCISCVKEAARKKRFEEAFRFNPPNSHGGARFANNKDLRKAGLFRGKGIPIGYSPDGRRALHYPGSGHIFTDAAARVGKGATLIINALLSLRRSVICIDPKAENAAVTGHARARFGKVFVLNPFRMLPDALKGLIHARFNPMEILDVASNAFHAGCDKLAAALVWDEGREGIHFTTAARMLVSGVIAALVRHGAACEKNLPTVARIISGDIIGFCRLTVKSTADPFIIQKLGRFAALGAETSREVMDVISTAITQLGFIGNAAIAECLSGSDFRFSDLRKSGLVTVYITLPLALLDVSDKFFRLTLETALWDLLNEGQRGAGKAVLAIVDEMAQLGNHMKSLENAMGMASGAAGLQIWSILQDLSQLKGMFPSTWETFIQNCGVTTWFGTRDQTTREYVSKLSGICEVLSQTKSVSMDPRTGEPQVSNSATQFGRPLLLPHEVGQIAPDEMIAFIEGVRCGPVLAKRKFYFNVFSGYRPNPYVRNSGVGFFRRLFGW